MLLALLFVSLQTFPWGFYAHRLINFQAVFLLPPEMLVFFKPYIAYLREHAVDPDRRRYIVAGEGPRHFIDLDHYQNDSLPTGWKAALERFPEDSLQRHGILPWWLQTMQYRLTRAFREKQPASILKLAADIGHYIGDGHVPLHTCSNYDGQFTNQRGIHALWESALPELLAEEQWQLFTVHASYWQQPSLFFWQFIRESSRAVDTVLQCEQQLAAAFPPDTRYSFLERNGKLQKQITPAFAMAYHESMNELTERRLKQSIQSVASSWYTAWVDAGQPDLKLLLKDSLKTESTEKIAELDWLWHKEKSRNTGMLQWPASR